MEKIEHLETTKLLTLHSIKFRALAEALKKVDENIFNEYELIFRKLESENQILKDINEEISLLRQNRQ